MGLGGYKKPDVPGTFKGPPSCRKETDGKKCGKKAFNTIKTTVTVFDKVIPVSFPVCDDHIEELKSNATDSASTESD